MKIKVITRYANEFPEVAPFVGAAEVTAKCFGADGLIYYVKQVTNDESFLPEMRRQSVKILIENMYEGGAL